MREKYDIVFSALLGNGHEPSLQVEQDGRLSFTSPSFAAAALPPAAGKERTTAAAAAVTATATAAVAVAARPAGGKAPVRQEEEQGFFSCFCSGPPAVQV
jgi:hypothetical protein